MKGKKSFVLYCDIKTTIEKLSNEKAGELFKHILKYVNDENPETNDIVIDIAFEPIKQSLKRDLIKYESICNRNKINGLKGGRPENPNEPKKPSGLTTNPNEPKKPDSDSDSDSDINNKKPVWKTDFAIYLQDLRKSFEEIQKDKEFISTQEKYYNNVDIIMSIHKSCVNFWSTEEGWKNKKSKSTKKIDWKTTFAKSIDKNKVYKNDNR